MTTQKKIARRKLSLLELASELQNVSKACRVMGYSRQQFYEIHRNYLSLPPISSALVSLHLRRLDYIGNVPVVVEKGDGVVSG